jgi:inorganic pyrophosphatase
MGTRRETPGPVAPDRIEVVIEIPKDSRSKYEIDAATGEVWLDRTLFTATRYPANYGYLPRSLAGDGDPLDVLVLGEDPLYPGVHLWARPVAVLLMADQAGPDAKVIAVPWQDPRFDHLQDLSDLSGHLREEIHHFFEVYKALEPQKTTKITDWAGRETAAALIVEALMASALHQGDRA